MKKILIVTALVISTQAMAFIGRFGGSRDTNDPEMKGYRVKNGELFTVGKGSVLFPSHIADDGVTVRITRDDGLPAMCVAKEAIASGAFGICQSYGYADYVLCDGSSAAIAAQLGVTTSNTAGHVEGGVGSGEQVIGMALDAVSTSTTCKIFLLMP